MRLIGSLLLSIALLGGPRATLAQVAPQPAAASGAITGVVVSAQDEQRVPFATVAVRRMQDSVLVGGKITDDQGRFRIDAIPPGDYLVEVVARGWARHVQRGVRISAQPAEVALGSIRLAALAVRLEGVVGQGQQSAVQIAADRSIYSVRDMPVVTGGSTTDALRTVPELQVDADDNITARGNNPTIYVNGRPSPLQGEALTAFLRTLPASRLDRIEYIANPSARFEADGQGGIVNLVLRQDASLGLSGSATGNLGTQRTGGGSARVNYQKGALTLFGGGSLGTRGSNSSSEDARENLLNVPLRFVEQASTTSLDALSGGVDVTAELKVTPRSTLWSTVQGSWLDQDADQGTRIWELDADSLAISVYDRDNAIDFYNDYRYAALGFRRVVQPSRHELSGEIRVSRSGIDAYNDIYRRFLSPGGAPAGGAPDFISLDAYYVQRDLSAQADLFYPLSSALRLEAGYRALLRGAETLEKQVDFPSGTTMPTAFADRGFDYRQLFNAAYLALGRMVGPVNVLVGVRGEIARTRPEIPETGETFENDYNALYPNLNLAYERSGRRVRFSYSRRIDRPTFYQLNPINRRPVDPYNRVAGNPRLDPSYTNSFSLDLAWSGQRGTVQLSPFYYQRSGVWEQVRVVDATGASSVQPENTSSVDDYGLQLSTSIQRAGPLSGSVALHAFRRVRELADDVVQRQNTWTANLNLGLRLSPTLNAQVTTLYVPSQLLPQGSTAALAQSSVALRKQLDGNRFALNLAVSDPLDVYRPKFDTADQLHRQVGSSRPNTRRATLSLTYNFGRTPQASRATVQDAAAPQTPGIPIEIR